MGRFRVCGLLLAASACATGPDDAGDDGTGDDRVTWHRDVAPIVAGHCRPCHEEGGIGPFSVATHAEAQPFADEILAQVEAGTMPPWGAIETDQCTPPAGFVHDPRLSDAEIETLAQWVEDDTPEGDPDTAAELPDPPELDLVDPDAVLGIENPFPVGGKDDLFVCFSLDPGLDQDVWLTGVQVIPDNTRVFHHAFVAVDVDAESVDKVNDDGFYPCFSGSEVSTSWLVGAYLPGQPASVPPDDVGLLLPAGARLILNVHYHPTGGDTELDRSELALRWQDEEPRFAGNIGILGNTAGPLDGGDGLQDGPNDPPEGPAFSIPAGASDHTETIRLSVPEGSPTARVWSVGTHMHYAGSGMRIELERPPEQGGQTDCLLETPRWDFDWQRIYAYDAPLDTLPTFGDGDRLWLHCRYDNTLENARLREELERQGLDAPVDIALGTGSLDEMCLGFFGVAWEL
jgi:hypothetical protein